MKEEYISDITEDQKDSRKNGDVQVIEAGECKDKKEEVRVEKKYQSKKHYG